VVAGEAAAGRAAGRVVVVADRSPVGQQARAREQDILRPVFFVETSSCGSLRIYLAIHAYARMTPKKHETRLPRCYNLGRVEVCH